MSSVDQAVYLAHRRMGTQVGSVSMLFCGHVDLENGFEHDRRRRHDHAIHESRHDCVELHLGPAKLWDLRR
jgi:hypothetical protein